MKELGKFKGFVKKKTHQLELKKRINKKPYFTAGNENLFFPSTLIYGLPSDKEAKALRLTVNTGMLNELLPDGAIFKVSITMENVLEKKRVGDN